MLGDFRQRGQTDVGQALISGESTAGDVDAFEALLLDDLSVDRVDGSGELNDFVSGQQPTELFAALVCRSGCSKHVFPF